MSGRLSTLLLALIRVTRRRTPNLIREDEDKSIPRIDRLPRRVHSARLGRAREHDNGRPRRLPLLAAELERVIPEGASLNAIARFDANH